MLAVSFKSFFTDLLGEARPLKRPRWPGRAAAKSISRRPKQRKQTRGERPNKKRPRRANRAARAAREHAATGARNTEASAQQQTKHVPTWCRDPFQNRSKIDPGAAQNRPKIDVRQVSNIPSFFATFFAPYFRLPKSWRGPLGT